MADLPDLIQTETVIIERTNAFRRSEGLGVVSRNAALDQAAKRFAEYLAKSGKFAHEADGRQPAERAKEAGYWYCTIAENLALNLDSRGFTVKKLADEAVEGWKASPGHRKNMLLPYVTEIGVGIARAAGPDPKFLSVQLFGRPHRLAYEFRIRNTSPETITYTFGGQIHTIEPRFTVTHTACDPGKIQFARAASWLSAGTSIGGAFEATDKALFVLRSGAGGKVEVQEQR
jgi:hypothetical protein